MPFMVNMTESYITEAENEGRVVKWAADVQWKEPPLLSINQRVALCWGHKLINSGDSAPMTYKCVNMNF